MQVGSTTDGPFDTDADTIVLGVFDGEPAGAGEGAGELASLLASGEARTTFRHLALTRAGGRRVIVAGLGPRAAFDPERARVIAAIVLRRAREYGARTVCWRVPGDGGDGDDAAIAAGLVHGTLLAAYRFLRFQPRTESDADAPDPGRLLLSAGRDLGDEAARATVLAQAQNRARDLANRPPNDLTPAALADYARALGERHETVTVTVRDGAEIARMGMGAFAAVALGSEQDARLIELRYDGAADGPRTALIGKAVTFDSGGLSLKPSGSQKDMKFDMCGGAAVIETIGVLAHLHAPVRVLGLVGATENMVNGRAMRPGDILTALDGTTVEMNNADAEGRLVLADCITHARREGADAIVDLATLTGAIVTALGYTHAGLMANDDALAGRVERAARSTGELVWRMPLHPDYAEMVKGRYAQITNLTERRAAPAITAAEFLHHFAGDVPWAHLDIAGVADNNPKTYLDKGGSGFGVRLLTELLLGAE
jgi:leucyl aminopeptidase